MQNKKNDKYRLLGRIKEKAKFVKMILEGLRGTKPVYTPVFSS